MDTRQGSSRHDFKKCPEEHAENTAYSLHGGCAFAPHAESQDLITIKNDSENTNFRIIVGSGEVEVTGRPCTPPARQKGKGEAGKSTDPQTFTSDELLDLCHGIEFNPPAISGDTMLVLLAVSPRLMHAYWEISDAQIIEARGIHGKAMDDSKILLRFYEIAFLGSTEPLNQFEVTIEEPCDNWYAHTWNDGKRFVAEIGLQLGNNNFHRLARSNCILLPPASSAGGNQTGKNGLRDYMYVEENTAPLSLPLPEFFSIFNDKEGSLVNEILDESWRDIHAEQHVLDVYRRVLAEGPRVLNNRPVVLPTPHDKLADEYHSRQETRRKNRKENQQKQPYKQFQKQPAEEYPAPELPADVLAIINLENSLNGLSRPATQRIANSRRRDEEPQDHNPVTYKDHFDPEPDLLATIVAEEPSMALHFSQSIATPFDNSWREEEPQEAMHFSSSFASTEPEPRGNASLMGILTATDSPPQESKSLQPGNSFNSSLAGLSVALNPAPIGDKFSNNNSNDGFYSDSEDDEITLEPIEPEIKIEDFSNPIESLTASVLSIIEETKEENSAANDTPQGLSQSSPATASDLNNNPGLNITATLTLRGTTPKDTTLLLDGREVPTEGDGSFEIECELDEGKVDLPFELKSSLHPGVSHRVDIGIDIMKSTRYEAWDRIRIRKP